MDPERQRRVEELFHSALHLPAPERALFLRNICPDTELREEVESLLAFESCANDFIEKPALEVAAAFLAEDQDDGNVIPRGLAKAKLERYKLLEKLGGGGMGVVCKAEDTRLRRTVALKFLPPGFSPDAQAIERFQREAHSASALNHPNICTIYDVGECEGQPFIVMEFLDGVTLEHAINGNPLPIQDLSRLSLQIAEGLQAAHAHGIIHRDIKPSNIFVTARGQAKVLDFWLAKLQASEAEDVRPKVPAGDVAGPVSDLTLTLTGAAMGTAGYMSPEQVRGEKLDARTDLFSFGLVLYEMATGKRAFAGDTGPEIQQAIICQTPKSARELNPHVPAKLQNIIRKALEKKREERYQSAADLGIDLLALQQQLGPGRRLRRTLAAGAAVLILLTAGTSLWYGRRHSQPISIAPEIKLRQLTANAIENRVLSGAISPDGKYLLYSDAKGIHLKIINTGETTTVVPPAELAKEQVAWEAMAWFPDSQRFLATAHPTSQVSPDAGSYDSKGSSVWAFTAPAGKGTKLRDQAMAWSASPDGRLISFTTNPIPQGIGDREVWIMDLEGQRTQKVFETADENTSVSGLYWSPNGEQVLYSVYGGSKDNWVIRDLKGGTPRSVFSSSEMEKANVEDLAWLPDGRLIYSEEEPGFANRCNFWEVRMDPRTGERISGPRRLTNWVGFCMAYPTATRDGKQMTFMESRPWNGTVNVADIGAGETKVVNSRHFLLDEYVAVPQDWTPDSESVIFTSYREGSVSIYRQRLDEDTPKLIFGGARDFRFARISPDGRWVLGFLTPKSGDPSPSEQLVRIPYAGGPAEVVLSPRPFSAISCARPPSNFCAMAEFTEDRKQVSIAFLDPTKGRGREIARLDPGPNVPDYLDCIVSNDGRHIAVSLLPKGPIHIVSVHSGHQKTVPTKLADLTQTSWAPDGEGLFVGDGGEEWYLRPHGEAHKLWENPLGMTRGIVSPDGRHVAIFNVTRSTNMWMMENF